MTDSTPRRFAAVAFLADLLVLVVFVVAGRRSHGEGSGLAGFLRVWWPFALGLVVATVLTRTSRRPLEWPPAVAAWLLTVGVGMAVRIVVQGRDLKPTFVVVTTVFLGAGMLGWRAVARRSLARRRPDRLRR